MDKENKDQKNIKRKGLFASLFRKREALDIFEEELIQSPWRTVMRTFRANRIAMIALFVFLAVVALIFIYPLFDPVDPSYEETSQQNIAPGTKMMAYPKEFESDFVCISGGRSFGAGVTKDGKIHFWGDAEVLKYDMTKIPEASQKAKFKTVSVGLDHIAALDEEGKIHSWGNNRLQQSKVPGELKVLKNVQQLVAAEQVTIGVTEDGNTFAYGNINGIKYDNFHEYQGEVVKVSANSASVVALLKDGSIKPLTLNNDVFSRVPEGNDFVDIACTSQVYVGLKKNGEMAFWGNISYRGENDVPEHEGKIIKVDGGRRHFTALMDNGKILSWGDNVYRQSNNPQNEVGYTDVFADYYQNYALRKDGKIDTWGLKGYRLGSDEYGRDLFHRLLNGGRMTITIGAVSVLIATIIGIIVGGVSGYFGGAIDLFLQRISEIVASLPFLPFAMILNALIGNKLTSNQRIYLMMVILGLLSWTGLQRLVRAQVLSVREQEYVTAAKAIGVKESNIVFRHIIPNVISVIIVSTTLQFAASMLTESTLSFLGFGVLPPTPTWGNMLYGAKNSIVIQTYWWRWVFPAIALSICVVAVNLIGDGLRDAIDPKSQGR